jgi:hypothetical protein
LLYVCFEHPGHMYRGFGSVLSDRVITPSNLELWQTPTAIVEPVSDTVSVSCDVKGAS